MQNVFCMVLIHTKFLSNATTVYIEGGWYFVTFENLSKSHSPLTKKIIPPLQHSCSYFHFAFTFMVISPHQRNQSKHLHST